MVNSRMGIWVIGIISKKKLNIFVGLWVTSVMRMKIKNTKNKCMERKRGAVIVVTLIITTNNI